MLPNRKRDFSKTTTTTTTTVVSSKHTQYPYHYGRKRHNNYRGIPSSSSKTLALEVVKKVKKVVELDVFFAVVKYEDRNIPVFHDSHPMVFYKDVLMFDPSIDEKNIINIVDPKSHSIPPKTLRVIECEKVHICEIAIVSLEYRMKGFAKNSRTCAGHVEAYRISKDTILKTFKKTGDMYDFFKIQGMIEDLEAANESTMMRHGVERHVEEMW